jgi:hypothetical protein
MQLVGGVVGAAVGSLFGMPQLGWAIGAGLAGMAQKPPKPAVGSLAPTEVEYGWSIPRVYGTRRQSTWRLWQSELDAHPVEAESKGGSQTVGYTYTCHMGLMICRRGEAALVRIWRNKELVSVFRTDASEEDIAASLLNRYWSSATFYSGAADQMPHPTYEAAKGTVPAYRGFCTLFIDDATCEGTVPPAIEVEISSGPGATVGAELWRLTTNEITDYVRSPGSIGYESPLIVPYKDPQRYVFTDTGYDGSSAWGSYAEALARGNGNGPGAIESTGEELLACAGAVFVGQSVSAPAVTDSYRVSGSVRILATNDVVAETYEFVIVYNDPQVIFTSPLEYQAVRYSFDASNTAPANNTSLRSGSSDVPCVAVLASTFDQVQTRVILDGGDTGLYEHTGYANVRYVVRDGIVYFGAIEGDAMVWRYPQGVSTPTFSNNVVPGAACVGLACDGTTLYVHAGATGVHPINADDLTSAGSNFAAPGAMIFCNSAGNLYCYESQVLYQWDGSDWNEVLDLAGSPFDQSLMLHPPLFEGGVLYATQSVSADAGFDSWRLIASIPVTTPTGVELNDILSNYWQACGIPASMIDLTATEGITVDGYTAEGSGKAVTDELAAAYYFGTVNDGTGIKTFLRGQASVATVPYADCGVGVEEAKAEPIELDMDSAAEQARRISVSAANGDADHQVMTETDDRILGPNVATHSVSLAISMSPEKLKGIANTWAADSKTSSREGKVSLGLDWIDLEIGDVVTLIGRQGETIRARLVQESFADYVRDFDYVLDRAADMQELGIAAGAAEPTLTVRSNPGSALVIPMDCPLLRDADDTPGMYVGADLEGDALSATVFQSPDNGSYASAAEVTAELTRGTLLTSLRAWNGKYQWDAYSTVDVLMSDGGTLTSSTKAAMHANRFTNVCLIGSPTRGWEVGRFVSASLIAADTYRVTTMLRALGGSEELSYLHPPGETFILLRDDGSVRSIAAALAQAGTRYWKAVPPGRTLAATAAVSSDFQSIRTKPLSPTYLRCERDASGNATFTWTARTRMQTLWNGAVFPDSEPSGTWRVEFFQFGVFSTAIRTKTVSAASVEYTAAEQAADSVEDPARIAVRVRRVSAAGQVGYALEKIR